MKWLIALGSVALAVYALVDAYQDSAKKSAALATQGGSPS